MASSNRQPGQVVHQDYIARVRYDNSLPPPSLPPKLLDIPGTGLAGGEYTSAVYASKMAREQPLNIEADAELGMPIDLVGIPGIFDGDETAIMARPGPQKIHPADKELLKPLSALGKGAGAVGSVSFLRRTEYVSSQGPQQFSSSTSKDLLRLRNDPKRRKMSMNKDDPINIIRNVVKGFDIAYPRDAYKGEENTANIRGAAISDAEAKAWSNPEHPTKKGMKLLDSYPVLPDLDALPSTGCYFVTKFTNPLASGDSYDNRLDAAILRQKQDEQAYAKWNQKNEEWKQSSSTKPQPIPEDDYEYFLPADAEAVRPIKRKLNVNDPENEDENLYTDEGPDGQRVFKYTRLRTYGTYQQTGDPQNFYDESVALALHDPEDEVGAVPGAKQRLQKGAYFYPIMQRTALRPKRNVGPMAMSQAMDEERIDEINLTVGDVDEGTRAAILEKKAAIDPTPATTKNVEHGNILPLLNDTVESVTNLFPELASHIFYSSHSDRNPNTIITKKDGQFSAVPAMVTQADALSYVRTALIRLMYHDEETVLEEKQSFDVQAALAGVTINPAMQTLIDHEIGSLEANKKADFVILNNDIRTIDPKNIH